MHLKTPKRVSRKECRLQGRVSAKSKIKSFQGWVQRFVANELDGMDLSCWCPGLVLLCVYDARRTA